MGAFFGIFTFPISSYSMRFFFRNALKDNPELFVKTEETAAQNAVNDLKSYAGDSENENE
jgi:hypothetical protein